MSSSVLSPRETRAPLEPDTTYRVAWLGVAASLVLLVGAAAARGDTFAFDWVPVLGLRFSLAVDDFAGLFLGVVGVVGVAVFAFSASYLRGKSGSVRFVTVMIVFAFAMAGLVASADVFTLFVFWEATTFTSYLLIGHHHQRASARYSARKAVLITGAGGLAMLAGLIILAGEAGTSDIAGIVASSPESAAGWSLVLIGAMSKSAQFPFHTWLPSAMAAPTPASAFLHSATMVKAGIVLVGRLAPGAGGVDWWTPTVVAVGLITMAVGGVRALRQHDLKLILAYGTVSALGAMFALVGSGNPAFVGGGIALLVAHALYKSTLFLSVGAVESSERTRDIRRLSGVGLRQPGLFAAAGLAVASMAGLPLTFGFASKEAALEGVLSTSAPVGIAFALLSALTAAYSVRFLVGGFGGPTQEVGRWAFGGLVAAPAFLAVVGAVLAFAPGAVAGPESAAVAALVGEPYVPKLVIWPGFVPAFWLSLAGLVLGSTLGWLSLRWSDDEETRRAHGFDRFVDRAVRSAGRITAVIQNGSLPSYVGQILVVAVVAPMPALLRIGALPVPPPGGLLEWTIIGFLVVASLALLRVRRRMTAVLLLGGVGYAMSALFALAGAPDVAITQVLVETLVVTLFALALRLLPLEFATRDRVSRWKVGVAVAVGLFAMAITVVAGSFTPLSRVSEAQIELAVPEADGANVVNVTLVDFRAIDTLGEIAVLGIAALGVMALVRPFVEVVRRYAVGLRESPILARGAGIINPLIVVFAAYLLFAGHNQPGGGFAAGLVASGWLVIVWLTSGAGGVRRALRLHPSVVIGVGLLLAVATGLGGFVWGDGFLASQAVTVNLGSLGDVKAVTPLLFDTGVALTVLGSVAAAVRGLEAA